MIPTPSVSTIVGVPDAGALRRLAVTARPPCVSIHLPLEAFPATVQNAVRAHQAVEAATKRLDELALEPVLGCRMSERLSAVVDAVEAETRPQGTLVALVDAECVRLVSLACRLPPRVAVCRTFVLRPLLRARVLESRYRLLAVSAKRVALFEGDARGLVAIPLDGLPSSQDDAASERKLDAERFHSVLGRAVALRFHGDATPLVLAADVRHQSGLRGILRMPGLLDEGIVASPDPLSPSDLHARAWPLVVAGSQRREREVLELLERARNRRRSVLLVDEVARAVVAGRVRTLWVEEDATLPGRVDPSCGSILDPTGDDDVMEHLVALALARNGEVHVVAAGALPTTTGVAAELY